MPRPICRAFLLIDESDSNTRMTRPADESGAANAASSNAPGEPSPEEGRLDDNVDEMHDRLASNPAAFRVD